MVHVWFRDEGGAFLLDLWDGRPCVEIGTSFDGHPRLEATAVRLFVESVKPDESCNWCGGAARSVHWWQGQGGGRFCVGIASSCGGEDGQHSGVTEGPEPIARVDSGGAWIVEGPALEAAERIAPPDIPPGWYRAPEDDRLMRRWDGFAWCGSAVTASPGARVWTHTGSSR